MKKKKITIGIFNDSFYPLVDGVISVIDNYAKYLTKYANVIVFVPYAYGQTFDDSKLPYKVIRCKSLKMHIVDYSCPIPDFDRNFKKKLDQCKLDIVHIHSPFFVGNIGIKYAKKHNIPVIGTMHSQFKKDLKRATKSEFLANVLNNYLVSVFNKCDECWAVNNEVARIFYEDYHYKQLPKVMNNATEMLPVKDIKEANNIINKMHNISKNEKVFLFVGRLTKLKNITFIVESIKIVKEKNPNLKFKMLFVGSGQDEDLLKKLVNNYKLENEIIFCGKVTDRILLSHYFARADIFLFPSLYDASSIVQIEAASQKTPTIFLENSATSATVTNNVNGFIVKNDINEYANKIVEVINNDKLLKEVSNNAYKDLYVTWSQKLDEVYKLYLDFIKNKKNE